MIDPFPRSGCQPPGGEDAQASSEPTDAQKSRRHFLKDTLASGAAASLGALASAGTSEVAAAQEASKGKVTAAPKYHYIPATDKTVHWGYFSKSLKPVLEVDSGDFVTVETLTHHAND